MNGITPCGPDLRRGMPGLPRGRRLGPAQCRRPRRLRISPLPLRENPFAIPRDRRGRMSPGGAPHSAGRRDSRRGTSAPRDRAPHATVPVGRRSLPAPRRRDRVSPPIPRLRRTAPPDFPPLPSGVNRARSWRRNDRSCLHLKIFPRRHKWKKIDVQTLRRAYERQ